MNELATPLTDAECRRGAKHAGGMAQSVHADFARLLEQRIYKANGRLYLEGLPLVKTDDIKFLKEKNTK